MAVKNVIQAGALRVGGAQNVQVLMHGPQGTFSEDYVSYIMSTLNTWLMKAGELPSVVRIRINRARTGERYAQWFCKVCFEFSEERFYPPEPKKTFNFSQWRSLKYGLKNALRFFVQEHPLAGIAAE